VPLTLSIDFFACDFPMPRWAFGGELKTTPPSQTKKLTAKDAKDAKNGKNETGKHNDHFIFAPFASFAVKNKPLF
jgi:hypothetical protein